jgi:hypothetical protein
MPWWWWIVAIALVVASRPIEARLWRAGRLSDRAVAILLLSRLPLIALLVIVSQGAPPAVGLFLLGISVVPGLLAYRWVLALVRGQHAQAADPRA